MHHVLRLNFDASDQAELDEIGARLRARGWATHGRRYRQPFRTLLSDRSIGRLVVETQTICRSVGGILGQAGMTPGAGAAEHRLPPPRRSHAYAPVSSTSAAHMICMTSHAVSRAASIDGSSRPSMVWTVCPWR